MTGLCFSTAYHPQTQGIVERMNAVIGQMLQCTVHEMNEPRKRKVLLPMIELAINYFPNRSTGYSSFFLNYRFHPVVPSGLIKGNEIATQESIDSFVQSLKNTWSLAVRKMKHAQEL